MKKLMAAAALLILFNAPAQAILGLGFGIHGGVATGYKYDALNDTLQALAGNYGWAPDIKFDDKLTTIGLHVDVGTLPIIDITAFGDYAWKSKDIGGDYSIKVHDLSFGATIKKKFGTMIIKPYVGVGGAMHGIAYTFKQKSSGTELPFLSDETKFGFHFAGGVELSLPVFPVAPFAEGRYNIISTSEKSTKYFLIVGGVTLKF
jgi:opacity protein-like surface antigen